MVGYRLGRVEAEVDSFLFSDWQQVAREVVRQHRVRLVQTTDAITRIDTHTHTRAT